MQLKIKFCMIIVWGSKMSRAAKEKIMEKRKEHFFDDYVKSLIEEAGRLGITKKELIHMIEKNGEDTVQK